MSWAVKGEEKGRIPSAASSATSDSEVRKVDVVLVEGCVSQELSDSRLEGLDSRERTCSTVIAALLSHRVDGGRLLESKVICLTFDLRFE